MLRAFLTCITFSALIACSSDSTDSNEPGMDNPIEYQLLQSGGDVGGRPFTEKQTKVITSQDSYAQELSNYSDEVPTQVDFDAGAVLLIDMGERRTGGYSIEVTDVVDSGSEVTASVSLKEPGQNCILTQALTNPYQFLFIASKKEITVSESLVTIDC